MARPNVYLFGDGSRFVENEEVTLMQGYRAWCEHVRSKLQQDPSMRLVILEVGCGMRVPTIRKRGEELLASCPQAQASLLRINPEFDDHPIVASPTLSIRSTAEAALAGIDEAMSAFAFPPPFIKGAP